jgi:methyl-accepting chemotaxis protein
VADVDRIFRPAVALLARLRYAHKILLVAALLVLPLGFVTFGYVDIQRGQVAFSEAERDGVAYLRPLLDLTVRTVRARHQAVSGGDPAEAGVAQAVTAVDAADAEHGAAFETTELWTKAKTALDHAAATDDATSALTAYNDATAGLLAVINRVSDRSNLTLDPDLDSYYVMDALVFRLPVLLDTAGQAVDEALVHAGGTPAEVDSARIDLAVDSGALATTIDAVKYGLETSYAHTASNDLLATKRDTSAMLDSLGTALAQTKAAVRGDGGLAALEPGTADATSQAIGSLNGKLVPILDALLDVRIGGFQAKAYTVEAAAVLGLVGVYLLVAFYRSVTAALRRMVHALGALAAGDLTRTVPVDTRDELGTMATAFNEALSRVREAIESLRGNASAVAGSSTELAQVSRELRGAAEATSAQAEQVSGTATRVAQNVDTVAGGTREMTAAIQEVASGAAEAAAVSDQAVRAAGTSNEAVRRLGHSSGEIGDVVKAITTIAEQINLLALNAAIEAARAGDAGLGFAVVANEVKDLSGETARARKNITSQVEAIQADTSAAVSAIGEIGDIIGRINEIQTTIASAVEEQTATTGEMSRGVTEVATDTTTIADGLAGVARSAEQTTSNALVTENAADQLARTADELEAIVARFRT